MSLEAQDSPTIRTTCGVLILLFIVISVQANVQYVRNDAEAKKADPTACYKYNLWSKSWNDVQNVRSYDADKKRIKPCYKYILQSESLNYVQ